MKKGRPATKGDPFPSLPAEFGRYRVLRMLGRGGMGAVYLAEDSQLGRRIALKIPSFDAAESPQRVERFVREARSAAALHHPNICTVFDAGQIGGRPFITMAYVEGKSLADEIDPDAPMPQRRAAEVARKVALALAHAHGKGTVHRDLKPANVMMAADGEPVVMDFGLAKRFAEADPSEAKLTREGGVLGTPSYMPPEQVRGDGAAIGPATDVYSLGVMLFEMLAGRTPYSGSLGVVMGQILHAPVPPVREFRPDAEVRLDAICRKAMAKEPAERFRDMAEFADALGEYLNAPVTKTHTTARPKASASTVVIDRPPFDDSDDEVTSVPVLKRRRKGKGPAKVAAAVVAVALALLVPVSWWLATRGTVEQNPSVKKEAPGAKTLPPAAPKLAPENSEWAGTGQVTDPNGVKLVGGTWTFTARRGRAFEALWRSGGRYKTVFAGVIDDSGSITFHAREYLEPAAKPREAIKGTGEIGKNRMSVVIEELDNSATARVGFKLLPDGGKRFDLQGRWKCYHRPSGWIGTCTSEDGINFIDSNRARGQVFQGGT